MHATLLKHETILLAQEKNLLTHWSYTSFDTDDTRCFHLYWVTILVNKSAGLSSDLICSVYDSLIATDSCMAMISNCITLFLKCWLSYWGVMDKQHVISINIQSPRYRNPHHPQCILDGMQGFHSDLHGNKLCAKHWSFYGRLVTCSYKSLTQS